MTWTDAVGQAELVRTGEVSPTELVDAAIARIEAVDPQVHAVVSERFEAARAEAAGPLPDGPFRGVPFLLKNLTVEVAGYPLDDGMRFLADARLPQHRHRSARATVPRRRARHARAHQHARARPAADDRAGGARPDPQPVGARPHPRWIERRLGRRGRGRHGRDGARQRRGRLHPHPGVVLRSRRAQADPRAACRAAGPATRSSTSWSARAWSPARSATPRRCSTSSAQPRAVGPTRAPAPVRPFAQEVGAIPARCASGCSPTTPPAGPWTRSAWRRSSRPRGCSRDSATRSSRRSPPAGPTPRRCCGSARCGWRRPRRASTTGPRWSADRSPRTTSSRSRGPSPRWATRSPVPTSCSRRAGRSPTPSATRRGGVPSPTDPGPGFDLLLTPTVAEPPVPHGTFPSTRAEPLTGFIRAGAFVPFTTPVEHLGPARDLAAAALDPDGRPVGVQLVAAFGREDVLIAVAAQLEAAAPWADRRPPLA